MKVIDVLGDESQVTSPLAKSRLQSSKSEVRRVGLGRDQVSATGIVKRIHFLGIADERLGRGKLHRIEPCPDAGSTLVAECTKAALAGNASASDWENPHAYALSDKRIGDSVRSTAILYLVSSKTRTETGFELKSPRSRRRCDV